MQAFIEGNANPDESPNFVNVLIDDMAPVVSVLSHPAVLSDATFTLVALTVRFVLKLCVGSQRV